MFRFIKQVFISALMYFSNLSRVNSLECISMKNQECRVRPEIVDINNNNNNNNNNIFYPFIIKINKSRAVIVTILTIHMQEFVFLIL